MTKFINPGADPAHKETDRIIAGLEKKLKSVYREAEKNATEKFSVYMAKFKIKDEAHIADVASGKWSQKQYEDWRKNQLLYADTLSEIRDTIAQDLHNADKIAIQMVRDKQSDVYALNHNYGTYEVEHGLGVDTTYTLYDHDTVERLIKDDPQLLPKPSPRKQKEIDAKDIAWNKQKLTSAFTASILSGDSIPKMAQKISEVAEMDNHAAIRNARTMCTGAENAGRINSYKRAQGMGIKMKQEWMATLDSRTRDSHRMVDGEIIEVGKKFSNGCRFPGDPEAPAREVYNCRCTMVAVVNGINPGAFDKTDTLRRKLENATITYDEWKQQHENKSPLYRKGQTYRKINSQGFEIIDKPLYNKITKKAIKEGADIRRPTPDVIKRMDANDASAVTYGDVIYFRDDATVSDVVEEVYHFYQNKKGLNDKYSFHQRSVMNEIDAKEHLLKVAQKYNISDKEIELTKNQLNSYNAEKRKMQERGEWVD